MYSQGHNLYKLTQKITSWVLLGSMHTKINQNRARNSHLQTRKIRVEIQFCELKILALEKSCEFNNLPVANTKSYLSLKDIYK